MNKNIYSIITLSLLLVGMNSINAWTGPATSPAPTNPPNNNVDAPINVGNIDQVKNGGLGVSSLATFGGSVSILSAGPRIVMTDTDPGDKSWWMYNNASSFYLIADRNNNGNWSSPSEAPWPMQVVAGATSTGDYVSFSNKVRATEYCDRTGQNCGNFSEGADERILKTYSILPTQASLATVATARSYWNNLVLDADINAPANTQASNFAEICTWESGESIPTINQLNWGGETPKERLESCAQVMCSFISNGPSGRAGTIVSQANHCGVGSPVCEMGRFRLNCIY